MKVNIQQLNEAYVEWLNDHMNQRLGQFLMNKLCPNEVAPEIFYEEKTAQAYALFCQNYVNWD